MPKPEQINHNNPNAIYHDFSHRQKTAIIFVVVLSLIIAAVWLLQINNQIRKPFQSPSKETESAATNLDLSLTDSDGDGLSDYDELNIYKTSPYLEDTDSDGISDYDEVAQGTDPNCATGQNCYGSDFLINENTQTSSDYLNLLNENIDAGSSGTGAPTPETVINPADVTPAVIRQVLLEGGYDPEILQGISDEDLMASYQEAARLGSEDGMAE